MVTLRNTSMLMLGSLSMLLVVGCAANRHKDIPPSARLMTEDRASNIDFVAPADGEVFVEDRTANKLLYSGRLNEGERLSIEPVKDRVAVNGRTVRDQKIRDLDKVRVFFQPEPRADVAGARTIVQPVQVVQPARDPNRSPRDSEIIVEPKGRDAEIRVRPGADADAKVTVEPGDNGQKVTVEREAK
jgi:hypothetical protein